MALLSKEEIEKALARLGELALDQSTPVELLLVGGAAMVLAYNARLSTHDVDAIILSPRQAEIVRSLAQQVAIEQDLPEEWLNDGAKGYLVGYSEGETIFTAPGIMVRLPSVAQLLAMKLSAWRDDVDIADARRLLVTMSGTQEEVWERISPFLLPGRELKAQYAFLDLWETQDDNY